MWWGGGLGVSVRMGAGAGQVKGVEGRSEREAGGAREVVWEKGVGGRSEYGDGDRVGGVGGQV